LRKEAQSFLESYKLYAVQIECKLEERQQWIDLALSITGQMDGDRVQTSGAKDKMAQAVERCMAVEEEILSQVNKLAAKQKEVTAALERLDNPTFYKLLHERYIQFLELKVIADKHNSSYDWATTTHGRALKNLQDILDAE
jgi:hypothetical protein